MLLAGVGCASTTPQVVADGGLLEARAHTERQPARINDQGYFVEAYDLFFFDGYHQGGVQIDELDFFHIAGDSEAEGEIIAYREGYNLALAVGSPVASAGLAALLGAGGVYLYSTTQPAPADQVASAINEAYLGPIIGLALVGNALMLGGYGLFYLLAPEFPNREPNTNAIIPYTRAVPAAEAYNASH